MLINLEKGVCLFSFSLEENKEIDYMQLAIAISLLLLLLFGNKRSGQGHERNQLWCTEMGGRKVVCRAV